MDTWGPAGLTVGNLGGQRKYDGLERHSPQGLLSPRPRDLPAHQPNGLTTLTLPFLQDTGRRGGGGIPAGKFGRGSSQGSFTSSMIAGPALITGSLGGAEPHLGPLLPPHPHYHTYRVGWAQKVVKGQSQTQCPPSPEVSTYS